MVMLFTFLANIICYKMEDDYDTHVHYDYPDLFYSTYFTARYLLDGTFCSKQVAFDAFAYL